MLSRETVSAFIFRETLNMSANAGYWKENLPRRARSLSRLEQEQDQMNLLVFEELRERREDEVSWYARQLKLTRDREAK